METSRKIERYIDWCDRKRWTIIAAWLLILLGGVLLARKLELRTSFAELLPDDDPGVKALARTQARMGDISLLLIGVGGPDRDANLRCAERLTDALNQLPKTVCEQAAYNVRDLRDFFRKNKWLYLSEQDLEDVRHQLSSEIARRKNPMLVSLDEDEDREELKKRISGHDWLSGRFEDGLFIRKGDPTVWVAALPPGGLMVENAGEGIFQAAHRLVRENQDACSMHVHVGGPVATAIENRDAVERDILWVTITCLVLVGLAIAIYFRRIRAFPLVGVSATIGTVLAFAIAELAFGYLNSSTAFLGSIILGNGINYAIMLIARYEEERGNGLSARDGLVHAVEGVWKGTLVASMVASASYASLVVTSFRGFSQFGIMGAAGCLLSWFVTFTLMPALLMVLDRNSHHTARRHGPLRLIHLGRLVEKRAMSITVLSIVLSILAVIGMRHFLHDPFEYDFRKLNTRITKTDEVRTFDRNMDALFGRWPSPTLVLADDVGEVERIRQTIRRQDQALPGNDVIGQVVTIYDLLPGTPEVQQRKLDLIAKIRKLAADPAIATLDEKDRRQIEEATPPAGLRVLQPRDLPPLARRPFTEVDGTIGRVVLVYPVEKGLSVWNGRDLLRIRSVLQRLELADGKTLDTAGAAVIFGSMIQSVLHDGPIATAASMLAVMIIIFAALRPWRWAVLAALSLLIGVSWMVGGAGWAGVRVTFLNFIALPITFGIGVEYAVNVTSRYREHFNAGEAISSTGGTVALCSLTTIIGYGSLLAAQNQALQGFGAMSILGEIACLAAAVVTLPSLLVLLHRRSSRK
jgi:predicted RND superfamily exporter protein